MQSTGKNNDSSERKDFCILHDKPLEMFCHEDKCLKEICSKCINDHPVHLITHVDNAQQFLSQKLFDEHEQVGHNLQVKTSEALENASIERIDTEAEQQLVMCLFSRASVHEIVEEEDVNLLTRVLQYANFYTGFVRASKFERQMTISKNICGQLTQSLHKLDTSLASLLDAKKALDHFKQKIEANLKENMPTSSWQQLADVNKMMASYLSTIAMRVNDKISTPPESHPSNEFSPSIHI